MTKPTRDDILRSLRDMIAAAAEVVDTWSEGDLAGAVNNLEAVADDATALLEDLDQ